MQTHKASIRCLSSRSYDRCCVFGEPAEPIQIFLDRVQWPRVLSQLHITFLHPRWMHVRLPLFESLVEPSVSGIAESQGGCFSGLFSLFLIANMQEKLENRSTDDTLLPLVAAHILSNSWTSILASPFPIFGLLGRLKNMVSQAYLKSLDEGLLEETGECLPSLAEIILSDPPLQDCLSDRYLAWKEFLQEHSEMSLCQTFAFVSLLVLCPQHVNLAANIFLRQAGEILSPQGIKFGILALVTPWPIWDRQIDLPAQDAAWSTRGAVGNDILRHISIYSDPVLLRRFVVFPLRPSTQDSSSWTNLYGSFPSSQCC